MCNCLHVGFDYHLLVLLIENGLQTGMFSYKVYFLELFLKLQHVNYYILLSFISHSWSKHKLKAIAKYLNSSVAKYIGIMIMNVKFASKGGPLLSQLRTYKNFDIIIHGLTFRYFTVWTLRLLTSPNLLWASKPPTVQIALLCYSCCLLSHTLYSIDR